MISDRYSITQLISFQRIFIFYEKYVMDKSCLIRVPGEMRHLSLYLKDINYPIFFRTAGNGTEYTRDSGNEVTLEYINQGYKFWDQPEHYSDGLHSEDAVL